MTTLDVKLARRVRGTTIYLTALGVSLVFGLISGMAFIWSALDRAWAIYIGGFLSTLMLAAGVMALRCVRERLQRGEWWRGIYLGCATILPITTLYMGAAALLAALAPAQLMLLSSGAHLASRPDLLLMAPPLYASSLALALVIGIIYGLTSPFGAVSRPWRRAVLHPEQPTAYRGQGDPYAHGSLGVRSITVVEGQVGAPVPIQLYAPQTPGTYAVVIFFHGFMLANTYFSTILRHLASHGFIVVAPQMYEPEGVPFGKPSTSYETDLARQILDWLPDHLSELAGVTADCRRLGLAGHSRGGKVAWRLLDSDSAYARAVAGIDPVDGTGGPFGTESRVTQSAAPFTQPALVIGTDLGQVVPGPFVAPCAPKGDNHEQFYAASRGPAWHVLALDYGHFDMLDEHRPGCRLRCSLCLKGKQRGRMRQLTGGLLAAFFRGSLQDDVAAYRYLRNTNLAPAPVRVRVK